MPMEEGAARGHRTSSTLSQWQVNTKHAQIKAVDKQTSAALTHWATWPGYVVIAMGLIEVTQGEVNGWIPFGIGVCLNLLVLWCLERAAGPRGGQPSARA